MRFLLVNVVLTALALSSSNSAWIAAPAFAQPRPPADECDFLDCGEIPQAPTPPAPRVPQRPPNVPPNCGPHGDYVIVGVRYDDKDRGLLIRAAPNGQAETRGVIPPNGTDVGVTNCQGSWCEVKYGCQSGWAGSHYLSPRTSNLSRVVDVKPNDPDGLNVRTGPASSFPKKGSIPYNATDVIRHTCQPGIGTSTKWCLLTYRGKGIDVSGWASSLFLSPH
jgi:uncharacterized protein YraI